LTMRLVLSDGQANSYRDVSGSNDGATARLLAQLRSRGVYDDVCRGTEAERLPSKTGRRHGVEEDSWSTLLIRKEPRGKTEIIVRKAVSLRDWKAGHGV
jgi:hypothetical protein